MTSEKRQNVKKMNVRSIEGKEKERVLLLLQRHFPSQTSRNQIFVWIGDFGKVLRWISRCTLGDVMIPWLSFLLLSPGNLFLSLPNPHDQKVVLMWSDSKRQEFIGPPH